MGQVSPVVAAAPGGPPTDAPADVAAAPAGLSLALQDRLRAAGIAPTLQRLVIAEVMLARPAHLNAEQVLAAARAQLPDLSRATLYGTLQLFVQHGLLRALPIAGVATVYDSTVTPHHHLYDMDSGEVRDLDAAQVQVLGLPLLAADLEITEVDVVVRVRHRARPATVTG